MSDFEDWKDRELAKGKQMTWLEWCEKAFEAGQQSKEAAIQEMDEVIKMQDADLRKYEKQLEGHQFTINATVRKLSEAEKRIDAVRAIMNEYYTGSFDESPELAGLISAALEGDHAP